MKQDQMPAALIFVLGAIVGTAAALLFARKSGEEFRKDIAESAGDGVDQLRSTGRDLKRRAQRLVEVAKERTQDALDAGDHA